MSLKIWGWLPLSIGFLARGRPGRPVAVAGQAGGNKRDDKKKDDQKKDDKKKDDKKKEDKKKVEKKKEDSAK